MQFIRRALNPFKPLVKRFYGLRAVGDFKSWDEALARSSGYEAEAVLKATLAATINTEEIGNKSNPAVERILTTIQELHPVRILDFGGGMGKFYFTLRSKIPVVNWDVVELPATVQVARNLKNEKLHFYSSIAAAPKPDLVVASGSLQYCQSPVSVLDELKELQVPIILDRVPIVDRAQLSIQIVTVPFKARLPLWFITLQDIGDFRYRWDCGEGIWLKSKYIQYRAL